MPLASKGLGTGPKEAKLLVITPMGVILSGHRICLYKPKIQQCFLSYILTLCMRTFGIYVCMNHSNVCIR